MRKKVRIHLHEARPAHQTVTTRSFSKAGEVVYPLTDKSKLSAEAVDPCLPSGHGVTVHPRELGAPPAPDSEAFAMELAQVARMRIACLRREPLSRYASLPRLFQNMTMDEACEAVHRDAPNYWSGRLAQQFLDEGAPINPRALPAQVGAAFVNRNVLVHSLCGAMAFAVARSSFAAKWYYGQIRPEEAMASVRTGAIHVDKETRRTIERLHTMVGYAVGGDPALATAYPEGCPMHPSYPAMHSAISCSSVYLPVVLDLTEAQVEEARRLDYCVAWFRTLAGVHYLSDNVAGLALGQRCVQQDLPELLSRATGASAAAVRSEAKRYEVDWSARAQEEIRKYQL